VFGNFPKSASKSQNDLHSSADDNNEDTRRGWLGKVAGGTIVTGGLVANKIAIRGPTPYEPPINSLKGKVIIITGGNTGLGLESAKRMANAGATIMLTSRSKTKGKLAIQDVQQYCLENSGIANNNVYSLPLDLCDLDNVKEFANLYQKSPIGNQKIDVLLNNAGVMAVPERELTKDGYEKTFQTNHLGHFALTSSLLPFMNTASREGARVVNVSSMAYTFAGKGLDIDNINGDLSYGPWDSYGQSKLQNILFTKELQRRAKDANINLTSASLHPGLVRTDLARYLLQDDFVSMQDKEAQKQHVNYFSPKFLALLPLVYFSKSVERGATTQIWLASGQGDGIDGNFYQNCNSLKLAPYAEDMEKAKELWEISEKLSGVKYNF